MIQTRRSKKNRSKTYLFNPYQNGISSYDLAYLSSKRVLKNKNHNLQSDSKKDYKKQILEEISTLMSSLTKKSKKFVMAKIDDNSEMYFEDESPCCFLEIISIGSLNPKEIAKPISNFVYEKMKIPLAKIYISFEDVPASMWAWNGTTFG